MLVERKACRVANAILIRLELIWPWKSLKCPKNVFLAKRSASQWVKVPISSKFLFSHQILYFLQWTSAKKVFDLNTKRFFNGILKTWKFYYLAVDPCRWSQDRHAQNCDVDSGTCDFRLDLSRLFYLCKFSFVVHAKCPFPEFFISY